MHEAKPRTLNVYKTTDIIKQSKNLPIINQTLNQHHKSCKLLLDRYTLCICLLNIANAVVE